MTAGVWISVFATLGALIYLASVRLAYQLGEDAERRRMERQMDELEKAMARLDRAHLRAIRRYEEER